MSSLIVLGAGEEDSKPRETVTKGVNALAHQTGYSWVLTTENENAGRKITVNTVEGKCQRNGYTMALIKTPSVTMEIAAKGTNRVLKSPQGWNSPEDLEDINKKSFPPPKGFGRDLPNLLRQFRPPHEELKAQLDAVKDFKKIEEGVYQASFTPEGIRELLLLGTIQGGGGLDTSLLSGSIQFRFRNGVLMRAERKLLGKIFGTNQGVSEINSIVIIQITPVDNPQIEIPKEAQAKLK